MRSMRTACCGVTDAAIADVLVRSARTTSQTATAQLTASPRWQVNQVTAAIELDVHAAVATSGDLPDEKSARSPPLPPHASSTDGASGQLPSVSPASTAQLKPTLSRHDSIVLELFPEQLQLSKLPSELRQAIEQSMAAGDAVVSGGGDDAASGASRAAAAVNQALVDTDSVATVADAYIPARCNRDVARVDG